MAIELNPKQERLLHEAMQQRHFRSIDEALDEALRSIITPAREIPASAHHSAAEAAQRIRELRKGNILPEGVTIRSLMDEGRA